MIAKPVSLAEVTAEFSIQLKMLTCHDWFRTTTTNILKEEHRALLVIYKLASNWYGNCNHARISNEHILLLLFRNAVLAYH